MRIANRNLLLLSLILWAAVAWSADDENGQLDTGFGVDGVVIDNLFPNNADLIERLAVQDESTGGGSSGGGGAAGHLMLLVLLASAFFVTSCGGGGGGGGNSPAPQPPPANVAPTALASSSAPSAYSSETVELDGSQSSDADGQVSGYSWTQTGGPAVGVSNADMARAAFIVPRLEDAAEIEMRLEVTDDDGASDAAVVTISVTPAPIQLTVDISGNLPLTDGSPVSLLVTTATLDGSNVVPVNFSWESSIQGGLASGFGVNDSVDLALDYGDHVLTLTGDFGDLGVVTHEQDLKILPRMLEVSSYLATPAAGYTQLMPVVLVTHIPTQDGITLDLSEANYPYRPPEWNNNSVEDLIDYIETINTRQKFILEEMSRFRGYKNASNNPYLGYQIVAHFIFYEPLPLETRTNPFDPAQQMVDFAALMSKIDGQRWVDTESVREFWFNNYFNAKFQFWESNMSSPATGDISNSDRFNGDLPVYDKSYVIYGTNYHRTQAEAVHNHGHQIEVMLDYVDRLHSGTSDLFWGEFVGVPNFPGPAMIPGRCGWTHQPPNTTIDYGYLDQTLVDVDCEDWKPDGTGMKTSVNSAYFETLSYAWPDGIVDIPQKAESQFYIWWGQNMPGDQNTIPYIGTTMENWWKIIGDWDSAIANQTKLYQ